MNEKLKEAKENLRDAIREELTNATDGLCKNLSPDSIGKHLVKILSPDQYATAFNKQFATNPTGQMMLILDTLKKCDSSKYFAFREVLLRPDVGQKELVDDYLSDLQKYVDAVNDAKNPPGSSPSEAMQRNADVSSDEKFKTDFVRKNNGGAGVDERTRVGQSKGQNVRNTPGEQDAAASQHSGMDTTDNSDRFLYKMNHKTRGKFIIINNKTFQSHQCCTTHDKEKILRERYGTDEDANDLKNLFQSIGFEVTRYNSQTKGEMERIIREVAAENHSERDAFGLAILSHGTTGVLCATDNCIEITDLIEPIKSCESLGGKPKLFFFQACRGRKTDDGVTIADNLVADDDEIQTMPKNGRICIPLEADFLFAYSTVLGYYAWRDGGRGSWFIQAVVNVLSDRNLRQTHDIARLLNRVCYIVAYDHITYIPSEPDLHRKKQVPSIVSTLTKDLYLK